MERLSDPNEEVMSVESIPPPSPVSRSSSVEPRSTSEANPEEQKLVEGKIRRIQTFRDKYSPYSVPPNFFYSDLHQKCRRVLQLQAKFDEDNEVLDDYCPCCNYPIDGDLFPLSCSIRTLNELGEGFPLYYDMMKYVSVTMILAFLIAGVYGLVTNYSADRIEEYDANLDHHFILLGTLGNC